MARGECNHGASRALNADFNRLVPPAKAASRHNSDSAVAKKTDRPLPNRSSQNRDCLRCSPNTPPPPAPAPIGASLLDLLACQGGVSDLSPANLWFDAIELHFLPTPVFAIEHPPRAVPSV
jgi:hypothetical protein